MTVGSIHRHLHKPVWHRKLQQCNFVKLASAWENLSPKTCQRLCKEDLNNALHSAFSLKCETYCLLGLKLFLRWNSHNLFEPLYNIVCRIIMNIFGWVISTKKINEVFFQFLMKWRIIESKCRRRRRRRWTSNWLGIFFEFNWDRLQRRKNWKTPKMNKKDFSI